MLRTRSDCDTIVHLTGANSATQCKESERSERPPLAFSRVAWGKENDSQLGIGLTKLCHFLSG